MTRAEGASGQIFAHRPLFTLAALYGAAVVPLGTLGYAGRLPVWQMPSYWHGHEMLFGFALAVVGGYLLTRLGRIQLGIAVVLWLLGRAVAAIEGIPPALSIPAALAYPVCLFVLAGLPLLRAAKRWRNLVFAPLLGAFVLAELLFQAGAAGWVPDGEMRGLLFALSVVAMLLFLMGGRVTAAAASGAMQRAGAPHRDMAQGRVETAGVAGLAAMAVGLVVGLSWLTAIGAAAALICATARLLRWAPVAHWRRPELLALMLGYGWLAAGAALLLATAVGRAPVADALHGIAAGALGTLSAAMMTRVSLQRTRRPIALSAPTRAAILCVGLAALARLLVLAGEPQRLALLGTAAALWSAAFLIVAAEVWRARPPRAR
ncbi:MAG: short-chain dehydrogenase [Alphaproteobacteria bacterium]|nr:MAG: short-chain dehydrogenase [Alphaproteobacteria bacterium]